MAFNLYCDPKVSSPDNLLSSVNIGDWYLMDEYPDKKLDGSGDYLNLNWEWKNNNGCRKEISQMMSQSHDILDMLPSDPFDMNISARCTMFTGWIEEVDEGIVNSTGKDETEVKKAGDDQLFLGMNLVLTEATTIYSGVGDIRIHGKSVGDEIGRDSLDGICDGSMLLDGIKEFGYGKVMVSSDEGNEVCDGAVGAPPDALFFALGHLGVRDLLSVERVCKSLRDGVQNDPLLWRSICIDQPISIKLTDDSLLKLTDRANGSLQSLSLVKCFKITDNGLKSVLQRNPGLTKLSVPGCIRLSVEGLICNLKALKSTSGAGIKYLRIGGLRGVTTDYFEELKNVLSENKQKQLRSPKPRFYNGGQSYLSFDDERVLDIEACPKCHQLRQVYDCPAESCQEMRHTCRGCTFCIARCFSCGCCFNGRKFTETFCMDFLCVDCFIPFLDLPHRGSYHVCLYG